MAAPQGRLSALVLIVMASTVLAQGQQKQGRDRGGRRVQPAQRTPNKPSAPTREQAKAASHREMSIPNAQISVIPVKYADVWELISVLNAMRPALGQRVMFGVYGGRDTLVVGTDNEKALAKVQELVSELDVQPFSDRGDVCQAVRLRNSPAMDVWKYLVELAPRRESQVRIVGDKHANTVWIAGERAQVAWFAEIASKMDEYAANADPPADEGQPELQFYRLAHAEAEALAETVTHIGRAMDLDAAVVADEASATLIAYATPAAHAHLKTIIAKLDMPAKQARKRPPAPRKRAGE